jgi:hypothetical protein
VNPTSVGSLCADLVAQTSCGYVPLASLAGITSKTFAGIGGVGTKVYLQLPQGRTGCLDIAPSTPVPCAGQPYTVAPSTAGTTSGGWESNSEIVGARITAPGKPPPPSPAHSSSRASTHQSARRARDGARRRRTRAGLWGSFTRSSLPARSRECARTLPTRSLAP